jgi:membrane-associated phospholipid phosphatase
MMSQLRGKQGTLAPLDPVRVAALVLSALLMTPAARAQEPPLRHDAARDGAVIATIGSLWIMSETSLKDTLAPARCRWCESDGNGKSTLNAFDASIRDALRWQRHGGTAGTISDVSAFLLVPALALGLPAVIAPADRHPDAAWVDGLVIVQAAVVAAGINQAGKFFAGRERPFVHALPEAEKTKTAHPNDNNLSFFSGHTTLTFALATAAGTVTTMNERRYAPVVWASGLSLALGTGYLRIAADKHYASDVLVGMVVGSLVGVGLPLLFHSPPASPVPTAGAAPVQSLGFGAAF